ncbi:hypothetical protein BC827DRAFT_1205292 [Russula dissimulans]|nr:hypothetical protein BC827DRAFT_1205292 [Russula dissimulans]
MNIKHRTFIKLFQVVRNAIRIDTLSFFFFQTGLCVTMLQYNHCALHSLCLLHSELVVARLAQKACRKRVRGRRGSIDDSDSFGHCSGSHGLGTASSIASIVNDLRGMSQYPVRISGECAKVDVQVSSRRGRLEVKTIIFASSFLPSQARRHSGNLKLY